MPTAPTVAGDQVAHINEDGWFHADEETHHAVSELLPNDDADYEQLVNSYAAVRNALDRARI